MRGVVKHLTPEQNRVTIAHQEIPGFMPAMTMECEVRDPAVLSGLSPEDTVRFSLEHRSSSLSLPAVKRLADAAAHRAARHRPVERAAPDRPGRGACSAAVGCLHPVSCPGFPLTDQDDQPFGLSSLRGKVVLPDFIFTHCPG